MGQARQRRDEIAKIKASGPKFEVGILRMIDGQEVSATCEQRTEANSDLLTALHESSHAVAAWMLGSPLLYMGFNNGRYVLKALAMVRHGLPNSEMVASSVGERAVYARIRAFVELAGVFGLSREAYREDNPFLVNMTAEHVYGAQDSIATISTIEDRTAINDEVRRLVPIVIRTFEDRRVQITTETLAQQFIERRELTGQEATDIIAQAYHSAEQLAAAGSNEHERTGGL